MKSKVKITGAEAILLTLLEEHGILLAKASRQLETFINNTAIPVAVSLMGKSAISADNPNFAGMLGMHGNYAPNVLTNQADLLIAAGMRFDDRVTGDLSRYAKNARIIHIDIDKSELNKNVIADVPVHADIKEFLDEITPAINYKTDKKWVEQLKQLFSVENIKVIGKECFPENGKIRCD